MRSLQIPHFFARRKWAKQSIHDFLVMAMQFSSSILPLKWSLLSLFAPRFKPFYPRGGHVGEAQSDILTGECSESTLSLYICYEYKMHQFKFSKIFVDTECTLIFS